MEKQLGAGQAGGLGGKWGMDVKTFA